MVMYCSVPSTPHFHFVLCGVKLCLCTYEKEKFGFVCWSNVNRGEQRFADVSSLHGRSDWWMKSTMRLMTSMVLSMVCPMGRVGPRSLFATSEL
jgi:hypothetical protein